MVSAVGKISIIIPCYNEDRTILKILDKIDAVVLPDLEKEVIIVDDGSDDMTRDILKGLEDKYKIIYLPKNGGKGYALSQGFAVANGDIIIIQDADVEYSPDDYLGLLKPILAKETKIVYGSRFISNNDVSNNYFNYLGVVFLTKVMNWLYGSALSDYATGYKVFKRELLNEISLKADGFHFDAEMTALFLKNGHIIKEVPISYKPRSKEQGKKIRLRDGLFALMTFIKYKF